MISFIFVGTCGCTCWNYSYFFVHWIRLSKSFIRIQVQFWILQTVAIKKVAFFLLIKFAFIFHLLFLVADFYSWRQDSFGGWLFWLIRFRDKFFSLSFSLFFHDLVKMHDCVFPWSNCADKVCLYGFINVCICFLSPLCLTCVCKGVCVCTFVHVHVFSIFAFEGLCL